MLGPQFCGLLLLVHQVVTSSNTPIVEENLKKQLEHIWNVDLDVQAQRYKQITSKWLKGLQAQASDDTEQLKKMLTKTEQSDLQTNELFQINDKAGLTPFLWEGDIHLTENQLLDYEQNVANLPSRSRRQVTSIYSRWTNGIVYYSIDFGINTRKRASIRQALSYISERTCIRFIESNIAFNRIHVVNGGGCYSSVGMIGGIQTLSIGDGCEVIGTVAHEFTHALGVWHMQSRNDRDEYVALDLTTVPVNTRYNFAKLSSDQVINYTPYEYGSFMHYAANAFSTDFTSASIIPHNVEYAYTMGNRLISFYDIALLNRHYQCAARCSSKITCHNGGEQNPADCRRCNCPLGYGGDFCNTRTNDGGTTLPATQFWQNFTITMGQSDGNIRDIFTSRTYWIEAPTNGRVELQLLDMQNSQCNFGCAFNGVELKVKSDQQIVNPRYCCTEFTKRVFSSAVNPTPIIGYNRFDSSSFTIGYRYVSLTATTTSTRATPPTGRTPSTTATTRTTPTITTRTAPTVEKTTVTPFSTVQTTRTLPTLPPITGTTFSPTRPTIPTITTKGAPINGLGTSACKDFVDAVHCKSLSIISNFCTSKFYSPALIKFNCAESCGLCGKPIPNCSDTYSRCADLKRLNYCNLPDKMLVEYNCAKTCGFCEKPN